LEFYVQANLQQQCRDLRQSPCLKDVQRYIIGYRPVWLDAKRCENLAHAAPMDSFSICSNARMSLRRDAMWG
jgi:hypothetical protein